MLKVAYRYASDLLPPMQAECVKVMSRNKMTRLTERQQEILALIDHAGRSMAQSKILAVLGPQTNKRQLHEDLAMLKAQGLVTPTGRGRGVRWRR